MVKYSSVIVIIGVIVINSFDGVFAGPFKRPDECCDMPNMTEEGPIKRCIDEAKTNENLCIPDCVANSTNILNGDAIVRAALLATAREYFVGTDRAWDSIHDQVIDSCIERANNVVDGPGGPGGPGGLGGPGGPGGPRGPGGPGGPDAAVAFMKMFSCNRKVGKLLMCLPMAYFKNCPEPLQIQSTECTQMREKVANCNAFGPPPNP